MLAILSSHEAQRKIDFRVHSHMCRLLCHPDKPVGVEELRIRGHRTSDAGKLTKDVEGADLSSDHSTEP